MKTQQRTLTTLRCSRWATSWRCLLCKVYHFDLKPGDFKVPNFEHGVEVDSSGRFLSANVDFCRLPGGSL